MQINFHNPASSKVWIPAHENYAALEVVDENGAKITIFVNRGQTDFLQEVIVSAAKVMAALEEGPEK